MTLTEDDGTVHRVKTGTFGYYSFEGLTVGQTAVVSVSAKRFVFDRNSQIVSIKDNIAGLDFIAAGELTFRK